MLWNLCQVREIYHTDKSPFQESVIFGKFYVNSGYNINIRLMLNRVTLQQIWILCGENKNKNKETNNLTAVSATNQF